MDFAKSFHRKQLLKRLGEDADRCVQGGHKEQRVVGQPAFPSTQPAQLALGQSFSLPDIRRSPNLPKADLACDFDELHAKIAVCLDRTGRAPRKRFVKRSSSRAQTEVCTDDSPSCTRIVGCAGKNKKVMTSIAEKIDAYRSASATPCFDKIRECTFKGHKMPDATWLSRKMRPKEYYLGALEDDPWHHDENGTSEDFLQRNSSSVEISKSRPQERRRAIEERAIEQEAREEKAQSQFLRNQSFQKQLRQKKDLASACNKVGREVLGSGVLPVTPAILQQVQWMTVLATAMSMHKFHSDLKRKKALIKSSRALQGFWRARRQFVLPQRRMRALRKLSIALICSRFAGKLLHRHRLRPSASCIQRHHTLMLQRDAVFLSMCFAGRLLYRHRFRSPTHAKTCQNGTVVKCMTEEFASI
eukprot:gnl/MRDRNA2_/MRDRNA2_119236_c0_seq1.p1 gnl/MRDRNA2_/MRDRNA2_119236_c0~~gnl/MRDRNA2_/MRDRNA2_119236_c0_seq1.p1  ORF type:complete len:423 (-),score=69.90 gnl/MRDRNA2_/MRDRNA2_119236_c0_seq1:85-1332(-)